MDQSPPKKKKGEKLSLAQAPVTVLNSTFLSDICLIILTIIITIISKTNKSLTSQGAIRIQPLVGALLVIFHISKLFWR